MYKKIILLYIFSQVLSQVLSQAFSQEIKAETSDLKLECNIELITWGACLGKTPKEKDGVKKLIKAILPEDKKICNVWTGYIETECVAGKWKMNSKMSLCKSECVCCY
jgi:hypothetical protein